MKISMTSTANGYIVRIEDTIKNNGLYVFRGVDIIAMLEFVGKAILDKNVRVEER